MEGPISFWGYKEQESNLILPEHDDDDEVPDKLIRLIALTLTHTRTRVKVKSDFTEFIVKCRVKQEDPLSATLFSLVTDTILK